MRRGGLTLVELLISIAILAVGAVVIMQALARGAHALTTARNRSKAYVFSAAKLADLELSARQGIRPKTSGRFGAGPAFTWALHTAPHRESLSLQLMILTVGWRQGRHDYESSYSLVRRMPPEDAGL